MTDSDPKRTSTLLRLSNTGLIDDARQNKLQRTHGGRVSMSVCNPRSRLENSRSSEPGHAKFLSRRAALLTLSATLASATTSGRAVSGSRAHPDTLSGRWTNATATPLERPAEFASLTVNDAEAAAFAERSRKAFLAAPDEVGGRQSDWFELGQRPTRIGGAWRTSLIVDPPNGKLPYSGEGKQRLAERQAANLGAFDNPEERPPPERCLAGGSGSTGAPILNPPYNANYVFVQTSEAIAILAEMNHDVRIIRLGEDSHLPPALRPWMGDSVGRWESETLVAETCNFNAGEAFKPSLPLYISPDAVVTERFTRISPGEILYAFTVDDPVAFTQPWRGEALFTATASPLYEYACHEGNYSLESILSGARQAKNGP
jgi:hypothetical protein